MCLSPFSRHGVTLRDYLNPGADWTLMRTNKTDKDAIHSSCLVWIETMAAFLRPSSNLHLKIYDLSSPQRLLARNIKRHASDSQVSQRRLVPTFQCQQMVLLSNALFGYPFSLAIDRGQSTMSQRVNSLHAIGERLHALLAVTSLTIGDVAHITSTPQRHVVEWVEGRMTPPSGRMRRLAQHTGVTLAWIYYGDEGELLPQITSRLRLAIAGRREGSSDGSLPDGIA